MVLLNPLGFLDSLDPYLEEHTAELLDLAPEFARGRQLNIVLLKQLIQLLETFFGRAEQCFGLKSPQQTQAKIPHYLYANPATRLPLIQTVIASLLRNPTISRSLPEAIDLLAQMPADEFTPIYAQCYEAVMQSSFCKPILVFLATHMPQELQDMLVQGARRFHNVHIVPLQSIELAESRQYSLPPDRLYFREEHCSSMTSEDVKDTSEHAYIPVVLAAPWFPSGTNTLFKVITLPRRGRLQDNLAISKINFRIIDFANDTYFVHLFRSPQCYDASEQRQMIADTRGTRPKQRELVELPVISTRLAIANEYMEEVYRLLGVTPGSVRSRQVSRTMGVPGETTETLTLDCFYVSFQWLLDSVSFNELTEVTDYVPQTIIPIPLSGVDESTAPATENACTAATCYCGRCHFLFRDADCTGHNLETYYPAMRADPYRYSGILGKWRERLGMPEGWTIGQPIQTPLQAVSVELLFKNTPNRTSTTELKDYSFEATVPLADFAELLATPEAEPVLVPSASMKLEPITAAFQQNIFNFIFNDYIDADTVRMLEQIIRQSGDQLTLRQYLNLEASDGRQVKVRDLLADIRSMRYRYSAAVDTLIFDSINSPPPGRCYAGSGIPLMAQALSQGKSIIEVGQEHERARTQGKARSRSYRSLPQYTRNTWLDDVSRTYPLEEKEFEREFQEGIMTPEDYVLYRNAVITHYLESGRRPFKCFVLYDVLPIPVDVIAKIYNFLGRESLINAGVERSRSFNPVICAPESNGFLAEDVQNGVLISDPQARPGQQVPAETVRDLLEARSSPSFLQAHALLGSTIQTPPERLEELVSTCVQLMRQKRTPLGLAQVGAEAIIETVRMRLASED